MAVGARRLAIHAGCGHESRNVGDLGVFERAGGFAAGGALAVFLVGCEVEGDEEEEVGADDAHAGERCEFFSGALSGVRHPLEVGRGEVCVRCEVDESCRVIKSAAVSGLWEGARSGQKYPDCFLF